MVFQNMSWFRKVLVASVGGAAVLGVGTAGVIAADQSISNQPSTEVTGGALGGLLTGPITVPITTGVGVNLNCPAAGGGEAPP